MAKSVLIDTGPLVAALRRRDEHHEWARAHFEAATEPFVSCGAVISESLFLLERTRDGKEALCGLLKTRNHLVRYSFEDELTETLRLTRRYDNTHEFCSACLVRMVEKSDNAVVFNHGQRLRTIAQNGRQVIPLIMPT